MKALQKNRPDPGRAATEPQRGREGVAPPVASASEALSRKVGNRALARLLVAAALRPGLTVSRSGDPSERGAEPIAEGFMRMVNPAASRPCTDELPHAAPQADHRDRVRQPMAAHPRRPVVRARVQAPMVQRQEELTQVWRVGPIDALRARRDAQAALRDAQATGLPGLHNGPADAWRHCYWNCLMTASIGEDQARTVADTHEEFGANPRNERGMDLHNNATGRSCGTSGGDCWRCCMHELSTGALVIIPDWGGAATSAPVPSGAAAGAGARPAGTGGYTYGRSGYGGYSS